MPSQQILQITLRYNLTQDKITIYEPTVRFPPPSQTQCLGGDILQQVDKDVKDVNNVKDVNEQILSGDPFVSQHFAILTLFIVNIDSANAKCKYIKF